MKKVFTKISSIILVIMFAFASINIAYANDPATSTTVALKSVSTETTTEKSLVHEEEEKTETDDTQEVSETQEQSSVSQDEAKDNLDNQRLELEEKLKKNDELLAKYENESKACAEYIDALDEKIGYMNEELTLLDKEIASAQKKANSLKSQIDPLNAELEVLQKEWDEAKAKLDKLNDKFNTTYNAYCLRLRVMYISGNTSIIGTLLASSDLSQFFSRYEMIKAVAKSDTALLKEVNKRIEQINTQQDGLDEKTKLLNEKKADLSVKQNQYNKELAIIESKQSQVASKKISVSQDRAEVDSLLAEYTAKTQMYTEYRNEDEALIKAVDNEIDDLINGLKDPAEVTTANVSDVDLDKTVTKDNTDSDLYSRSNAVLNLTYPAPGHYSVSAPFGHYSSGKPHTGIDFPCPTGSKIVAAQKGIVIKVKRLNYSYGYYVMVYHGTDAKGRKVVTLYAHNSSILVGVGQTVKKGQQIAKSGSTGNSTGPHTHFELIIGGTKTNPRNYFSK